MRLILARTNATLGSYEGEADISRSLAIGRDLLSTRPSQQSADNLISAYPVRPAGAPGRPNLCPARSSRSRRRPSCGRAYARSQGPAPSRRSGAQFAHLNRHDWTAKVSMIKAGGTRLGNETDIDGRHQFDGCY